MVVDENTKIYVGDTRIVKVQNGETTLYDNSCETLLLLHFDNNINDSSKYNRNGTPVGNLNYVNGKFNKALNCDAYTGGVYYDNDAELYNLYLNSFTIEAWVKPTSFSRPSAYNAYPIVGQYKTGNWYGAWLLAVGVYNNSQPYWQFKLSYGYDGEEIRVYSNTTLNINEWNFLTVTLDKDKHTIVLYQDGIKVGETVFDFNVEDIHVDPNCPDTLSIGYWFSSYTFLGNIDEIRIGRGIRYNDNFIPPNEPFIK